MKKIKIMAVFILFLKTVHCGVPFADYDESLGKNDSFFGIYYHDLIQKSDNDFDNWFRYINREISGKWLLKTLAQSYYKNFLHDTGQKKIPYIIHQIWIGPKPFPEKYKKWQQTWQSIPGWTYKLWTDKEVETFPLINRTLYNQQSNMAARSDILRIEILYQEGGVYVDTDFECLQPDLLNDLACYDFYCGLQPLDYSVLVINNAIIGSIPHHPILKEYIDKASQDRHALNNKYENIVDSGPGLFTRVVALNMDTSYRNIVFPPTYFYPVGAKQLRQKKYSKPLTEKKYNEIKNKMTKKETIAIHWWDASWT